MKDNMKIEMEAHKNQQLERITEFDGDCVFLYKPNSNGYEIAQQVLKEIDNKE